MWLTIIIGIGCSLLAVLMYNLCQSLSLYFKMKRMNGTYFEFDENGNQKGESECTVKLKCTWMIILGSGYYLQINQINEKRLWESRIPLHFANPLIATGTYKYSVSRTWGIQKITINLKDEIMFVRSEDQIKKEEDRKIAQYWLQKKS